MSLSELETGRRRVLSGMRPTGRLHLGNYMGALYNWVRLQEEYECYFFIADWHALTTDYADPSRIRENTLEVALDFLSAGLDPEKCTIFVQSHVPQHAELHLLLSMITPLSWLERVPSYKDQQEQLRQKDLNTYGFLGYPLLQSADILLYRPHFVPVGLDQAAHVELTREVSRRFNSMYEGAKRLDSSGPRDRADDILPEPEVLLTPSSKLPGLDGRKMSKSYGNTIMLTDQPNVVQQKLASMSNGGQRALQRDPGDPEVCPVGDMHRIFSSAEVVQEIELGCREARISCLHCKSLAADGVNLHLDPIRKRRFALQQDPGRVVDILQQGDRRARVQAEETLAAVRKAVGLSGDLSDVHVESPWKQQLAAISNGLIYDLNNQAQLDLPDAEQRRLFLQNFWLEKVLPRAIVLSQDSDRVFITKNKKRAYVTTAEMKDVAWDFYAKPKSYEVLVLICLDDKRKMTDLIIPQKVYVQAWSAKKRMDKNAVIHFQVRREGDLNERRYFFQIDGAEEVEVTEYENEHSVLQ